MCLIVRGICKNVAKSAIMQGHSAQNNPPEIICHPALSGN